MRESTLKTEFRCDWLISKPSANVNKQLEKEAGIVATDVSLCQKRETTAGLSLPPGWTKVTYGATGKRGSVAGLEEERFFCPDHSQPLPSLHELERIKAWEEAR